MGKKNLFISKMGRKRKNFETLLLSDLMNEDHEQGVINCTQEINRIKSIIKIKEEKIKFLRLPIFEENEWNKYNQVNEIQTISILNQQNYLLNDRVNKLIQIKNYYLSLIKEK